MNPFSTNGCTYLYHAATPLYLLDNRHTNHPIYLGLHTYHTRILYCGRRSNTLYTIYLRTLRSRARIPHTVDAS